MPTAGNIVPLQSHRLAALFGVARAMAAGHLGNADTLRERARQARNDSHRLYRQGKLPPLGTDSSTGKRIQNTGRWPMSGVLSPLMRPKSTPTVSTEGRFRSRRERANELRERMQTFAPIYNAGWMVREAYYGPDDRRRERVFDFMRVLAQLMGQTDDYEALLFAVADGLYASPSGVPWEA
jgi:hypothetical protein